MNKAFKIISIVSFLYATLYLLFRFYVASEDSLFAKFENVYWWLFHWITSGEINPYTLKYSLILGVVSIIGYMLTRNSND